MTQIYEPRAYQASSLDTCFWRHDYPREDLVWPRLRADVRVDVAIIGAGYTGLSAGLHLAKSNRDVAILDMHAPGWGASGRNGGFCCIGGARASDRAIAKTYGQAALTEWGHAQVEAIDLVRSLLTSHKIDADTHSDGETVLAHSKRSYRLLKDQALANGLDFIDADNLADHGMVAQGVFGAATVPYGFGLHPRKYVLGLATAARDLGVQIFKDAGVLRIERHRDSYKLHTQSGCVTADRVVIATNGYSRDDVPNWMRARFMPVQSNIIVTRPITPAEQAAQGWTSDQMAYDTRNLLHYFRLLPSGQMMFGMRGGIRATKASDRHMHQMIRRDFDQMFPAWRHIETPWFWTGLVCMTARQVPFVGALPDMPGAFAGFGWHGNGVAMGTYAGKLLADLISGQDDIPSVMRRVPRRMPFGRNRRAILSPIYAGLALQDRFR